MVLTLTLCIDIWMRRICDQNDGSAVFKGNVDVSQGVHYFADEINPDTHYFGNRPRPKGVVEKCTFCIHRTRKGRYPACVEICPVGARKFGNLLDESGEMRYLMREKRVFVLKEELNTRPRFYYFYAT